MTISTKVGCSRLDPVTQQQQVDRGQFPRLEAVPQYAFTLTLPMLGKAKKIFCLAPEKRKAIAVKSMLSEPIGNDYPASFLRTQAQATLFLDRDSASLI